ncbi:uncharacterized protein LOC124367108 [Homalodisca vitripennis]|uniref:uncharacterized protein LOC124367108 n=1 Tax=Homalodisca vitripennis TaxID=197043 RepID=UPI001EEB8FBF|nr:uncharacterized protein LOC124367108 [Homalodisca vitripennis]
MRDYIHSIQKQGWQLVSAGEDGSVRLWDLRQKSLTNVNHHRTHTPRWSVPLSASGRGRPPSARIGGQLLEPFLCLTMFGLRRKGNCCIVSEYRFRVYIKLQVSVSLNTGLVHER